MNKYYFSVNKLFNRLLLLAICLTYWQGYAQMRIGAPSKDPLNTAAALEIKSGPYPDNTYKGVSLPTVALKNYATWTLAGTATDGMLVFNTATTTGNYAVTPGLYYWYNFQWNKLSPLPGATIISALDCKATTAAAGVYYANTSLTAGNNKQITITPGSAGTYSATTNVANGYSFSASGSFTAAQVGKPQTVTLQSNGTPEAAGTSSFSVTVENQVCSFSVTAYNYIDCSASLKGTYKVNQALDSTSNTKLITIVPKVAGNYDFVSIVYAPDASNTFSLVNSSTVFTTAQVGKPQQVILKGAGTPKVAGTYNAILQVSADGGQNYNLGCSFAVTVQP